MSNKDAEIGDLLGETKPAAKKTAPKKEAPAAKKAAAAPAKKVAAKKAAEPVVAKKAAPAKKAAEPVAEKTAREPVRFAEGERQGIYDKVTAHFKRSKKAINSRELAEKLDVDTRKLRIALYSLAKREEPVVALSLEGSKVAGMTVSPA